MTIPFEPTNSFCYRFSRYEVLPEIIALPEVQSGQAFRLVDMVARVVDLHLSPEQQAACYPRAQTGDLLSVIKTIKWYVPFLAKKTEQLFPLGGGNYRLPNAADVDQADIEDSVLEDGELVVSESDGFIYAFSFPALIGSKGDFPIKIGRTAGDVMQRVALQCRGSATFDNPTLLGSWRVERVLFVEVAIHKMLAARGKWRENVPGTEWFDTSIDEIKSIIDFIGCARP